MSKLILISLITFNIYSQILISSFDAFDNAKGNNSRVMAKKLVEDFKKEHPEVELVHCELRTVYDKSFETLKDCYSQMKNKPKFIISLGEGGCNKFKIETRAQNLDSDYTSDNDGIHRVKERIIRGASKYLPLSFNWSKQYCALTNKEKKILEISNNAGTFVCNHISYKMRYYFPELSFAFAHVPTFKCASKTTFSQTQSILKKVILSSLKSSGTFKLEPYSRRQTRILSKSDSCEAQFYQELLRKY